MELNYENNKIKKLFINILLKKGKKVNSEKIFKNLLINIKKIIKQKPYKIIKNFIKNSLIKIKYIELQKKKRFNKKKKKLYIFIYLNKEKQIKIPIKWLFKKNNNINNYTIIIKKIIEASKNKGEIINLKKKYYKEIKKLKNYFK